MEVSEDKLESMGRHLPPPSWSKETQETRVPFTMELVPGWALQKQMLRQFGMEEDMCLLGINACKSKKGDFAEGESQKTLGHPWGEGLERRTACQCPTVP